MLGLFTEGNTQTGQKETISFPNFTVLHSKPKKYWTKDLQETNT